MNSQPFFLEQINNEKKNLFDRNNLIKIKGKIVRLIKNDQPKNIINDEN